MPSRVPRILQSGVFAASIVLTVPSLASLAFAQTTPAPAAPTGAPADPPPGSSAAIADYWRTLYGPGVEPPLAPDAGPAPAPPLAAAGTGGFRDFLDHVSLRFGATYTHNAVEFTGRRTSTFVINDGAPGVVTPQGFSFPRVFQANDDQFYSYLVMGTKGYLDPHLNTYFSGIYRQDLSGVIPGSPFQSILYAFDDGRRAQVLNAYAEWIGLGTGILANTNIRVGRQFVFDLTPDLIGSPVIDGAMLSYRDPKLELAIFGGRRVNFFGNSETDFAFGGTATYTFVPRTSVDVNYISLPGIHRYAFLLNHQIGDIHTRSYMTFRNENPLQVGIRAWYAPTESPWTVRGTLYRQLTDEDFVYDMFADRELPVNDPQARVRRLLLREIRPGTQFTLDVDRRINTWLTVGGGIAARFVDGGEAPFDNSFEQVSARATFSPGRQWDALVGYRFRHVERSSVSEAAKAIFFDDISHAGETVYHELSGEIYYRFGTAVRVRVGGYVGLFDSRDRLAQVNDIIMAGGYLRTQVRVNRMLDLRLDYGIDRGNPEFNPDIKRQHTVRVGFDFYY